MLGSIDEQHVVRLLALFQHQDADRDAGGIEQVGRQADHGIDVAVGEQLGTDVRLLAAPEQHTVRQDSGSYVPEENLAAVLYDLSFEKKNVRSWRDSGMNLADVPPVLLAETYADYLKVAEACSGFDPEWQKKTPW